MLLTISLTRWKKLVPSSRKMLQDKTLVPYISEFSCGAQTKDTLMKHPPRTQEERTLIYERHEAVNFLFSEFVQLFILPDGHKCKLIPG